MTETGELFLGIIALAVVVMAAIQVAAVFAGIRLARRVDALATQIDQEIKPLIANLTALSSEAARAASLAARQAERLDRVFGEMVERVDKTLAAAHEFVTGPARQGMAIVAGAKAVFDAFRSFRATSRGAPRPVRPWTKRSRFSSADVLNRGHEIFHPLLSDHEIPVAGVLRRVCPGRVGAGTQVRRASQRAVAAAGQPEDSTASPPACRIHAKSSSARSRSLAS